MFISLMGVHHRQYDGNAYSVDEKGEVTSHYVRGRIMVNIVHFQEANPNYSRPRLRKDKLTTMAGFT